MNKVGLSIGSVFLRPHVRNAVLNTFGWKLIDVYHTQEAYDVCRFVFWGLWPGGALQPKITTIRPLGGMAYTEGLSPSAERHPSSTLGEATK